MGAPRPTALQRSTAPFQPTRACAPVFEVIPLPLYLKTHSPLNTLDRKRACKTAEILRGLRAVKTNSALHATNTRKQLTLDGRLAAASSNAVSCSNRRLEHGENPALALKVADEAAQRKQALYAWRCVVREGETRISVDSVQ